MLAWNFVTEHEYALHTAKADETIAPAAVVQSFQTRPTCTIINDGLHNDSVAYLVIGNLLSNLFNDSAEFMPESQGNCFLGNRVRRCWAQIRSA